MLPRQQSRSICMAQAGEGVALCHVPIFKAAGVQQGGHEEESRAALF